MVICLERGADLHMAQLIPPPLTVLLFRKIQIDFTFLIPAHPGSPWQKAIKLVLYAAHSLTVSCHLRESSVTSAVEWAWSCLQVPDKSHFSVAVSGQWDSQKEAVYAMCGNVTARNIRRSRLHKFAPVSVCDQLAVCDLFSTRDWQQRSSVSEMTYLVSSWT